MSLLNGGEAAVADLGMGVAPEDAGPAEDVVLVEGVGLAVDVVPVGDAGLVAGAGLADADSDEVQNH